jgi:hypothetical protein
MFIKPRVQVGGGRQFGFVDDPPAKPVWMKSSGDPAVGLSAGVIGIVSVASLMQHGFIEGNLEFSHCLPFPTLSFSLIGFNRSLLHNGKGTEKPSQSRARIESGAAI